MEQKRKLILTAVICAAADLIIIALIILFFRADKNKKAADKTSASANSAVAEETTGRDAFAEPASSTVAVDSAAPASQAASSVSGAAPASEVPDSEAASADAAGALTKEQIKRLLEGATETYNGWIVGYGPKLDRDDDTFTVGNSKYCRVTDGKYQSIAEISAAVHTYYTNDCYEQQNLDTLYIERDGKLYGYELLGQGGDMVPNSVQLSIVSQTDTECVVRLHYDSANSDTTYTLILEDGKWKFTDVVSVVWGYPYYTSEIPWAD